MWNETRQKSSSLVPGLFGKIIETLSSLRAAIVLLFVIAFASAVGTVFPQGTQGKASDTGSFGEEILSMLTFHDVFHSSWFFLLGILLCASLVLCSWRRVRALSIPRLMVGRQASRATGLLSGRGNIPRLGNLLLHVGVAIVICGFAYGQYRGFNTYVEIPEGATVPLASFIPGMPDDSGVSVRCEDFSVEYYDSGMPSEFRSELAFIDQNIVIQKGTLLVNHPLSFRGVRYYQAHYQMHPLAVIGIEHTRSGQSHTMTAHSGEVYKLGGETFFRVTRIEENFMGMGPAMKIDFSSPGQSGYVWVLAHIDEIRSSFPDILSKTPQFDPSRFEEYVFSLDGIEPQYVTGLSVSRDPGLPIVILGILLFLSGLSCVYLLPAFRTHPRKNQLHAAGES